MTTECLFCKIAAGQTSTELLYEDDEVVAFRDIHPKYRVHLLLVPKTHVPSAAALSHAQDALAGKLLRVGAELARAEGLGDSGFRLVTNTGPDSGQVIDHLHVHLLGGQPLNPL